MRIVALIEGSTIMKKCHELMIEAASVLTYHCSCQVSATGDQLTGIPNWHIVCAPRIVRHSTLHELWADIEAQAVTKQQRPMLMHLRRSDWACTSMNPFFDDLGSGFDNTVTQSVIDWWLFKGAEIARPGQAFDLEKLFGLLLKPTSQ